MLFIAIRLIIWLVILIVFIIKTRNSKSFQKKLVSVLMILACTLLLFASTMFPTENLLVSFKSPESVFNYVKSGKIDKIIYGKNSCMIIYSKNNSTGGHYIIPKAKNGFRIPDTFATAKVSHKFDKSGIFDVYNVKGTRDYYIFGTVHLNDSKNEVEILNDKNEKITSEIFRIKKTSFIYFYLNDFENKYYLLINGKKVSIANE